MISFSREGSALTLEGGAMDFQQLLKQVEKAADPEQKANVVLRILDAGNKQHLNLIFKRGESRDSL